MPEIRVVPHQIAHSTLSGGGDGSCSHSPHTLLQRWQALCRDHPTRGETHRLSEHKHDALSTALLGPMFATGLRGKAGLKDLLENHAEPVLQADRYLVVVDRPDCRYSIAEHHMKCMLYQSLRCQGITCTLISSRRHSITARSSPTATQASLQVHMSSDPTRFCQILRPCKMTGSIWHMSNGKAPSSDKI